jgi:hypothetical protein
VCEAIALDRAEPSKAGAYADGYRCAAKDIAEAIRRQRIGDPPTGLDRDIRDAEVEARTLARVVAAAVRVVADVGRDSTAADAVRRTIAEFFAHDELPDGLRPRPLESTTSLITRRRDSA